MQLTSLLIRIQAGIVLNTCTDQISMQEEKKAKEGQTMRKRRISPFRPFCLRMRSYADFGRSHDCEVAEHLQAVGICLTPSGDEYASHTHSGGEALSMDRAIIVPPCRTMQRKQCA